MKQNRDCKIVQDLLPNYIENLTDEVTNEYIEDHIATCPECARVLKNMNGEIKLEQINQDKEIKYLKGVRKRVKRTIVIVSLIVILIASIVIGYVYKQSQIQVNNYTFLTASYVIENQEGTEDGNLYGTLMAVFDENDVCISVRIVQDGYDHINMSDIYNRVNIQIVEPFANIRIQENSLHFNINTLNGYTKEEVKKYWINNYNIQYIEEI